MGGSGEDMNLNQNMGKYEKRIWYDYLESLFLPQHLMISKSGPDLEKRFNSDCIMPSFSQFKDELGWCEPIRESFDYEDVLEIKCKYCGRWFIPTVRSIICRIRDIKESGGGGSFCYCSNKCKKLCPVYWSIWKYRGVEHVNAREVPAGLRQMVFERDNWECQRCFSDKSLECHHVIPVKKSPIFQADIDNCLTLCTNCHKKAHSERGCRYVDLANCV